MRHFAGILLASSLLVAPAFAAEPACGPHEHLVVEKDADEGATVKRCVCDAGWDADGEQPPCRRAAKAGKGKAKPRQ